MKSEQIENLPIEWKRGNGLRKSDLDETGKNKCILYGELYTKHKTVLIDSQTLSKTNKQGKIYSKKGDILIPGTSTAAKKDMLLAREVNEDGILLGGDINIIRPKQGLFAQKYLPYYFMTQMAYQQLDRYITGATGIIHISNKGLKKLKVPLLSLPEQQRIVEILDKAFVAIDKAKQNAEQNLRNAKDVFVNQLSEAFENSDWENRTLGKIANHSLGKMLDKNKNQGILKKYLRNQSVRWFEFDLHDLKEMPFLEGEKEKYTAIKGDILICEGGYPGRAAIWQKNYPIYFQKAIHRVRFHEAVYNKWFLYYLFVSDSLGQLKKYFTGTGIQHFTGASLDKFTLPIPPKSAVKTLVCEFDRLSEETKKLEAIYQKKLSNLAELKKSILQKAFKGEL